MKLYAVLCLLNLFLLVWPSLHYLLDLNPSNEYHSTNSTCSQMQLIKWILGIEIGKCILTLVNL